MTNEKENTAKLLEAIENFRFANPNAKELQERVFTGYLYNCSTGAEPLTEEVVLFNQTLCELFQYIN
ncbi:MAG: hypothetical protein K0B10_07190 [Vicingaceae bacterium]|nr:hypothetical protein [Vicingaceae bacterium]